MNVCFGIVKKKPMYKVFWNLSTMNKKSDFQMLILSHHRDQEGGILLYNVLWQSVDIIILVTI